MSAEPNLPSRRYLGRYELIEQLGKGGMGEVWLAKISGAAGFEKPCIVKTVLPEFSADPQFVDRFHHEAKVLVHLVHSNIAQVFDMGEAEGAFFMALEYVPGVDLAGLIAQVRRSGQPLPLRIALHLTQKVAEGLAYAHRKTAPGGQALSVVHRDVSPHNVMVSYDGEVKVIDFGLAKSAARSKQTQQAMVMGKLGYMSPEQVRALPLDARTDIYSCGVMLWELLAGQELFSHGTVGEMMAAMAYPKVPSLRGLRPEVDEGLEQVVMQALAPEASARTARAEDLALGLAGVLMRAGAPVGSEEVGAFVRRVCPEAFAAQQRIASRLSTVNAPLKLDRVAEVAATLAERPGRVSEEKLQPGQVPSFALEATVHRPVSTPPVPDVEAPTPAKPTFSAPEPTMDPRPPSQLSPAELAAVRSPRGPMTLVVVGLLALVAIVGSGAALYLLGKSNTAEVAVPGPAAAPVAPPVAIAPPPTAAPIVPAAAPDLAPGIPPGAVAAAAPDTAPAGLFPGTAPDPGPAPAGLFPGALPAVGQPVQPAVVPAVAPAVLPAGAPPTPLPSPTAPGVSPPPFAPLPFPTAKPVVAKPPPGGNTLKGTATFDTTGQVPAVTLMNQSGRTWTRCKVTLPGRYVQTIPKLPSGFRRELPFSRFVVDAATADVKGIVQVQCAEGSAKYPTPF